MALFQMTIKRARLMIAFTNGDFGLKKWTDHPDYTVVWAMILAGHDPVMPARKSRRQRICYAAMLQQMARAAVNHYRVVVSSLFTGNGWMNIEIENQTG